MRSKSLFVVLLGLPAFVGCGAERDASTEPSAELRGEAPAETTPAASPAEPSTPGPGAAEGANAPADPPSAGGANAGSDADAPGDPDPAAEPGPAPAALSFPRPVGACPDFKDGTVTFNPQGGPRTVRLFMANAPDRKAGPLVFYWYGTYGQPSQAQQALGTGLDTLKAAGGIVAAPVHANGGQFPWLGGGDQDLRLADEIVGCALAKNLIDGKRIHSMGFSAGGLFTTSLGFARSNYIASIVTYSGGLSNPAARPSYQDPTNKYAALIFTGGARDNVFGTDFQAASQNLQTRLKANGHSAIYCDHGGGHWLPTAYRPAVARFFLDHPYGTAPSPYATVLPTSLRACSL